MVSGHLHQPLQPAAQVVWPSLLFSGGYKSLLVDSSGSGYLKSVCDYVHLNPTRAKLVAVSQPLKSFAWSSWPVYLLAPSKRRAWLRVDRLLGQCGIPKDSPAGRRGLEQALEERAQTEEAKAERIIAEELKRRGRTAAEFQARPKSDARKLAWRSGCGQRRR